MSELSKLKWHCRRGMKELDLVLTYYLEHQYSQAPSPEQHTFRELLDLPDIDLYSYLIGQTVPPNEQQHKLIEQIRLLHHQG